MPRVSEAHLAARREQILAAARRCFARNGFHATSMQDVIGEAGLSVGAVYRYFKSKDELRTAVAEEQLGAVTAELAEVTDHDPPLPLSEAMARVIEVVEGRVARPDGVGSIAVQAWGECLRDPELLQFVNGLLRAMRGNLVAIARGAQRAGDLPPDADPEAVGAVLMAILPGYIVQRLLVGDPDPATFTAGLRAVLARPAPPER